MTAELLRPVSVLMLAAFMMMAGMGTLTSVLGLRLTDADAPTLIIGLVMGAYSAGLTLGSLYAYRLIQGVGHIRAFSALASVISAATLLHPLAQGAVVWGALRLLEGFCMAGAFVCMESWLNQKATTATRGRILAFYMISLYAGQGAGQFLLHLEDGQSPIIFLVLSALLSLALVPVALTRQPPPQLPDIVSFGVSRLYRASPLGLAGTVFGGLVGGALVNMAPVYLRQLGHEVSDTALFMGAVIFGGILLQWPLGRLSDLFDRRSVIVALFAALTAVGFTMTLANGYGFPVLLAGAGLFGGIAFTLYPACVAHTNDHLPPADIVSASGGLVLGYSMGAALGPFAAAIVMALTGPSGLFLFAAGVGAAATLFGLWRMGMRPPVPGDLQAPYQTMPLTTPLVAPLDPRAPALDEPDIKLYPRSSVR